jgi:hypothetical protein
MFDTTSTQTQSVASAAVAHTTTFWTHIFGPGPFNRFRVCRHFGSTVPFQRSWIWPVDAGVFNVTKTALYIGLMQPSALVPHEPDLDATSTQPKCFRFRYPKNRFRFCFRFCCHFGSHFGCTVSQWRSSLATQGGFQVAHSGSQRF